MVEYKDIAELICKEKLTGDERLPVSGDEYTTIKDLATQSVAMNGSVISDTIRRIEASDDENAGVGKMDDVIYLIFK